MYRLLLIVLDVKSLVSINILFTHQLITYRNLVMHARLVMPDNYAQVYYVYHFYVYMCNGNCMITMLFQICVLHSLLCYI